MQNFHMRVIQRLGPSGNEFTPLKIRTEITADDGSATALVGPALIEVSA